jgi:dTDP-glucose 4,6-dehydratase
VGPRSVYDEAKRYAEALTSAYRNARGSDTAIVRIFNSYDPRMRPDDGTAIPTFIRQALAREPITVTGDGNQTRSVCFVADTVRGILALAESDHPGPINVGSPDELTMRELAEVIRGLVGSEPPITYIERPDDDPKVRRPDTTLAKDVLGWQPQVALRDGLAETIEYLSAELGFTQSRAASH